MLLDPFVELSDRFALHWKLDVGVDGMNVSAARMAQDGFADLLHHSRFHQPDVADVAQIMESVVAKARSGYCGFPGGLDSPNGPVVIREDRPFAFRLGSKQGVEPPGERNLPPFSTRCFGASHG